MTLVTVRTVVDIPGHALVVLVGRSLGMATSAREHRKIRRIRVARRAHAVGAAVIRGEPGVVEGGSQP